jgi:hypothetical protein
MEGRKKSEPHRRPTAAEMDERVKIPLDPETAIEALLKVDPESSVVGPGESDSQESNSEDT